MKKQIFPACALLVTLALPVSRAQAAEVYSYPELSVVPRASDRIEMEAQKEESRRWTGLLQIEIPAAILLTASFIQAGSGNIDPGQDSNRISPWVGGVVGAGWLAYGIATQLGEPAYVSAANELKSLPKGSVREQLTRERLAEELLQRKASQMRFIRYASAITMAGSAIYMTTAAAGPNSGSNYAFTSSGIAKVVDYGAIATSLIPIFFPTYYEDIASQQADYKKRIYAPVASSAFFATSSGAAPGLSLTWKF